MGKKVITKNSLYMKKLPKLKEGDLIEVIWFDAFTEESNPWTSPDDAKSVNRLIAYSVGFFVTIKKDLIRIVADRLAECGNIICINRWMTIPLGCVIKVRKLK